MLIPQKLPFKVKVVLYVAFCSIHGFLYGTLYAPAHAIMMNFNFEQTVAWILTGIKWDITHGISNTVLGTLLIMPIVKVLDSIDK